MKTRAHISKHIWLTAIIAGSFVSPALATPPQAKFFPLNREASQLPGKSAPKFFPLNKSKPMKLIFAPSGKNTIHAGDKQAQPSARKVKQPEQLSQGDASQLLSIYEAVD